MIALLWFFLTLFASPFKSKSRLEVENAVLRHQLIAVSASNLCSGPTHWRCCGHSRESCRWNRPPFRPRIARTYWRHDPRPANGYSLSPGGGGVSVSLLFGPELSH